MENTDILSRAVSAQLRMLQVRPDLATDIIALLENGDRNYVENKLQRLLPGKASLFTSWLFETCLPQITKIKAAQLRDEEHQIASTKDIRPKKKRILSPVVFEAGEVAASEDSATNQLKQKCYFWPNCQHGHLCTNVHPNQPCRYFPNCKFGKNCLYIHPACKFDRSCKDFDCPYFHSSGQRL
jgi:hypothetical protein